MKKLIKKYPVLSTIIGLIVFGLFSYLILLTIVIRPVSMSNGRMDSYDKSWSEIEQNISMVKIGMTEKEVVEILGEPDQLIDKDSLKTLSYQQYGVVAPHWIYDIIIKNNEVFKIEGYDW